MIPNKADGEQAIYERLAAALDKLPNGFPQTRDRLDLKILKKLFTPEQAALALNLSGSLEAVDDIAKRLGSSVEEATEQLMKLAKTGLARTDIKEGKRRFRLGPFILGFYETYAHLDTLDYEMAHLFEEYLVNGGAAGIMSQSPPLTRVIPVQNTVKSEQILPYEDVRQLMEAAKVFHVQKCSCRNQQEQLGARKCKFPIEVCLILSNAERAAMPGDVTKEEALSILDKCEEVGLVHCVNNVQGGGYEGSFNLICNCCGCCCDMLRGINEWGIEKSVAYSNYYAMVETDLCIGCGNCVDRCQVNAITLENDVAVVNRKKCIGCGLCVTGCTISAASLKRKPDAEIVIPPADFPTWEHERLHNRGLK
jgi:ferredoxin/DNA-binding transcriptional ArsR family regulator